MTFLKAFKILLQILFIMYGSTYMVGIDITWNFELKILMSTRTVQFTVTHSLVKKDTIYNLYI